MSVIALHGGKAITMTSREIAELTGSTHDNVLKTVRGLVDRGVVSRNETPYTHPQNGQTYTEFRLSYRDTMVVVSGYSVELRAKIIDRWQELEASVAPQLPDFTNPVAAARAWADAVEKTQIQAIELDAQQAQIESQRPAVEFVDRFVEAKSAKGLREVAKILGVREREFIADLADRKIIFKQGSNWLPFAEHQHAGRFEVKTGEANGHTYAQTRFTPEGIAWIAKRYTTQQLAVI